MPNSLGRLEVEVPALKVVLHPARSAHHNINPPPQGALLRAIGGPTIQAQSGEVGCPAHMLKVSGHLQDTQGSCLVATSERSTRVALGEHGTMFNADAGTECSLQLSC